MNGLNKERNEWMKQRISNWTNEWVYSMERVDG